MSKRLTIEEFIKTLKSGGSGSGGSSGGSGVFAVVASTDEYAGFTTLDKTWQEINDALNSKNVVIVNHIDVNHTDYDRSQYPMGFITSAFQLSLDTGSYHVEEFTVVNNNAANTTYMANSADGYPAFELGD